MNPVEEFITLIASVSIILYFLLIGYYLRKIMVSVEKLAGVNESKIVECDNCGKQINLGVDFREQYITCPICKNKVMVDQPELILKSKQQKEEVFPD